MSVLLLGTLVPGASAQQARGSAPSIEFVGLKRWTVQMIRDTMALRAPGRPLGECAAILEQIGFPSASSADYVRGGNRHIVVTLVEPADSARVRLRPEPSDSSPDRVEWREAAALFRTRNAAFQLAVSMLDAHRAGDRTAEREALRGVQVDTADVMRMWAFLDTHRAGRDLDLALWVLATDGNTANLAVSAAILANFADREVAWWMLMDAQRSSRASVAATASQALGSMAHREPPMVDWAPAAASVRHLVAGTNVFLLVQTLHVLRATRISPSLAAAVLSHGNGELVLAHLRAREPLLRVAAHNFLVQISGVDLGYDTTAWANWLATLSR